MHVGLGRQSKEAKAILAQDNVDAPNDCSPSCGQEPPEKNFLEVVVLAALSVTK